MPLDLGPGRNHTGLVLLVKEEAYLEAHTVATSSSTINLMGTAFGGNDTVGIPSLIFEDDG